MEKTDAQKPSSVMHINAKSTGSVNKGWTTEGGTHQKLNPVIRQEQAQKSKQIDITITKTKQTRAMPFPLGNTPHARDRNPWHVSEEAHIQPHQPWMVIL